MAIPEFQEFMLPFLRIAGDGKEHSLPEAVVTLADQMKIPEEERNLVLSSGQTRVYNRVAWAMTYLSKSALIEKTGRGRFRITPRGKEDRLGLDMVYVQAKRVENGIGPGQIREFVGSLGEHKANKGVFITCGAFTSGARDAAAKAHSRIVLIDGEQLAEFMIDHGVGVTDHKTYTVKKLDSDYFEGV